MFRLFRGNIQSVTLLLLDWFRGDNISIQNSLQVLSMLSKDECVMVASVQKCRRWSRWRWFSYISVKMLWGKCMKFRNWSNFMHFFYKFHFLLYFLIQPSSVLTSTWAKFETDLANDTRPIYRDQHFFVEDYQLTILEVPLKTFFGFAEIKFLNRSVATHIVFSCYT